MSVRKKTMRELGGAGRMLGISALIIVPLVPFYLGFIYSIKHKNEVTLDRLAWLQHPTISSYIQMITENSQFLVGYKNSTLTTIPTAILPVVVTSVAPWALARNKGKFYNTMYAIFALGIPIPFRCIMLPLYLNLCKVGLVSSSLGFAVARSGLQISISALVVTSFIKTVLRELEEAASIDGCNRFQTFQKTVSPFTKPINATQTALNTLFVRSDYNTAVVLLHDKMSRTLSLVQIIYSNENTAELNLTFAFFNMAMLPVLILYLCLQEHVANGVTSGAMEG